MIETSQQDQERVKKQIQDQKAVVDQVKSINDQVRVKEEEKKLKGFESDLSKLASQEDGYHKDITNSETNVREDVRNISDNETTIKLKKDDLDKQKEVINQLQKKLESIQ